MGARHPDPFCESDQADDSQEDPAERRADGEGQGAVPDRAGEGESRNLGEDDQSVAGQDQG